MKTNRVIVTANNNPLYYPFWNPISRVYKERFGIEPTLVWVGSPVEAVECGISDEFGDIIYTDPNPDYPVPFQCTWAAFWATQFFTDDVIMTIGIDQIPLSRMFIDMVNDIPDTDYAMLISDAYLPHHWTSTSSPSAYHIAKGSTFKKVHNFEFDFKQEIEKMVQSGTKAFWEDTEGRWGLDESWSCKNLRETDVKIHDLDNFGLLCQRRIECERHKEPEYDLNLLSQGWYSESHLCRPYTEHKQWIDNLFNNIPVCL